MKNIYQEILSSGSPENGLVLATVTGSSGSTPQKPGSSAMFRNNLLKAGTVGGGIVEGKVQDYAGLCSRSKESAFLEFSLDNDISKKEDAICGGTISILVDATPSDHIPTFTEMKKSLDLRNPGVLITVMTFIKEPVVKIDRFWMTRDSKKDFGLHLNDKIEVEVNTLLKMAGGGGFKQIDLPSATPEPSRIIFLEAVSPLPELVITGAGHIGRSLSQLGRMLGFEVTVIDSRKEYANTQNLPDADHIIVNDIGEAIRRTRIGRDTYVVIVTRGHSDDASALRPCIGSAAAYVGMIGSKSKVAKMHAEFIRNGWASEKDWQKIHAPVGLDIGSKTVEEIAVSIAAELVLVRSSINETLDPEP